jgi:transglutaminase-like putative cysteine protease
VRYDIVHTTEYDYSEPVAVSHHLTRLRPRDLPFQHAVEHVLDILPSPSARSTHDDYFGNSVTFFTMQGAHKRLTVQARTTVAVAAHEVPDAMSTPAWERVTDLARLAPDVVEFVFPSGPEPTAAIRQYAAASFPEGRPLLDAVVDLTGRIHADFTFDPEATTVATPLANVFQSRRGVCQDFARFEIACLRSLGIPARYVSGYLETLPPPGRPRLIGADASHAWLEVHCPEFGWVAVDPTNDLLPSSTHVTLAWGRDYSDVSPIRGVILGGGQHGLTVRVDVIRSNGASA